MNETRNCQNCKKDFVIEREDFDFYRKMEVPPPTWCPDCRMIRRLSMWNERNFFKKVEKRTGKEIFSTYPPEAPIEIYERDYWWSDAWGGMQFGKDIDWSRPFLAQVRELQLALPWAAQNMVRCVNSEYSNNAGDLKNCYLCFNADLAEDCMYGVEMFGMKNCVDFYQANSCQFCYEVFNSDDNYQSFFIADCSACRNVWLSFDCEDCSDCFGCVGLRHKQYNIFNEQYTKEGYFKKLQELNTGSFASLEKIRERFREFSKRFPRKFIHAVQNQDVSGDYIFYSKNVKHSYGVLDGENVKYAQIAARGLKDAYDYTSWGNKSELMYETMSCGEEVHNIKFCWECWIGCNNLEYSMMCSSSANLFGCVGLKRKQYAILNKQYTKEEYEALIPKIKKHMVDMPYRDAKGRVYPYGEFFPMEFSFVAINESAAVDFTSITKEQASEWGLVWREPKSKEYQITMRASDLPDHISDATEEILRQTIGCLSCQKGFRIIAPEFAFYKRFNIPLPRRCPNCRFHKRIEDRNLPKWYRRTCQCAGDASSNGVYANISQHAHGKAPCPTAFQTSYAPEKSEIVYCEPCYQREVA